MGKIQLIINKLTKDGSIEEQEKSLLKIIKDNQKTAINLNTDQLSTGTRSDGKKLPNYSKASVELYGKPDGPIRLFDEGDFYNGFFLHTDRFPVLFDSSDEKTTMLVEGEKIGIFTKGGYGKEIFGLDKDDKSTFVQDIKPEVQDFYRSLIHV